MESVDEETHSVLPRWIKGFLKGPVIRPESSLGIPAIAVNRQAADARFSGIVQGSKILAGREKWLIWGDGKQTILTNVMGCRLFASKLI